MDWTTVGSVLGSDFFVAVASLATARWQIKGADRQFNRQIKNEREKDHTERRREVRSEPLLKFRAELARMATKYEQLVQTSQLLHTRFGITDEEASNLFQQKRLDFNEYLAKGDFVQTLLTLDDVELVNKTEEITKDYLNALTVHTNITNVQVFDKKKWEEAMTVYKRNAQRVAELQGLVNQKLEDL